MKNNIHFSETRRDMLTSASEAVSRFRKYEEDYGVAEVERLIDAAHAIQMHIDADLFDFEAKKNQMSFAEKRDESRKQKKKNPAEPQADLMDFIIFIMPEF